MRRSTFGGVFILVEGPSDSRLLRRFFNMIVVQTVSFGNRENALSGISKLSNMSGVCSIVDQDCEHIYLDRGHPENIFLTDLCDLASTLFCEEVLKKILCELGSDEKIENWVRSYGQVSMLC
jgi:Protein of unknown function (DUF4435)